MQRQQQVASLRKQLKAKEDELAAIRGIVAEVEEEKNNLKRKVSIAEAQISQLEQLKLGAKSASESGSSRELEDARRRITEQVI